MKKPQHVRYFALKLQPSLMEEARKVAKAEGVAPNQLIDMAGVDQWPIASGQQFPRRVP